MTTTINADNGVSSGSAGLKSSADATGVLALQTNGTTAVTISTGQVVSLAQVLPEASGGTGTTVGYYGFKNRIINGAMVIDQRNAGGAISAATLANAGYTVDRWTYNATQSAKFSAQQNQGSVTPPAGYSNYVGLTSASAYSVVAADYFQFQQRIETLNIADLGWGTASAATVTLSFWVRSSLTGTFGGSLYNNAFTVAYPFSYTISSANTWTQISLTIVGPTTGVWTASNANYLSVAFSLGTGTTYSGTAGAWAAGFYASVTGATSVVGTSGATFYITGVQLEKGSTATSFDYRPYTTELQLCQRYLPAFSYASGVNPYMFAGMITSLTSSSVAWFTCQYPVTTRVPATGITVSSATHFAAFQPSTGTVNATSVSYGGSTSTGGNFNIGGLTGVTAGNSTLLYFNNSSALIYFTGCEL